MARRYRIVYYVTSHGFGHLNRAVSVVESMPPNVSSVVKTDRDLFARWRESVRRRCELVEGVFDCGAVHPPGESSLVDAKATLARYNQVHAAAVDRLDREVAYLQDNAISAVVSDIAPLPLRAAKEAGIPGILVANFTWADIFASYGAPRSHAHRELLREMLQEYFQASLTLRAQPAMESLVVGRMRDVGLVTRQGRNRQSELIRELGVPRDSRLVYIYVGRYGQADITWENLGSLSDFQFVSYHPLEVCCPHWHVLDPARWPPRDLAASVDVMVAKAGYGTVTDAIVNRTPLIYPPRFGFAEHRILAAGLRRWGSGIPVSTREFKGFRLHGALAHACGMQPKPAPWPVDGARRCTRAILDLVFRSVRSC
jgi:hypothetical protein